MTAELMNLAPSLRSSKALVSASHSVLKNWECARACARLRNAEEKKSL